MQYKKDEIKEKIDLAAMDSFAEKGYKGTKISDIAEIAKVSVGNIYRYYKGKGEIFDSVMAEDFLDSLKSLLFKKIDAARVGIDGGEKSEARFSFMNEEFIEFMIKNRKRILVLFNGSEGTRIEALRNEIIDYLIRTVRETYANSGNNIIMEERNDAVVRLIYVKLIEMLIFALEESENPQDISESLKIINSYHLFGVTKIFK